MKTFKNLLIIIALLAAALWAGDEITVTSATIAMNNGTYRVSNKVSIETRIIISGDVTLILGEGTTLEATKGIEVSEGNSLTIEGKGALNATGGRYAAGIGGGEREAGGAITINGGKVTATGGSTAAGIGGGFEGAGGTITISGGTVTATGGAAGIGGGYSGSGGTITISGGIVTATGGDAGIGGGYGGAGGAITINGGKVTATGGSDAAGIGGGRNRSGGTVTLGWTNEDDFIYASSYNVEDIKFADGKQFYYIDENDNYVMAVKENIGNRKILPMTDAGTLKYATISGIQRYYPYTENEINIEYEVVDFSGKKLVKDVDYVASIDGSKQVKEKGEYTLTITAKEGSGYTGSKTFDFSVVVDYIPVIPSMTEMNGNYGVPYKVIENVSIDERITIKGDVTLILGEGTTLEATKGIEVSEGNSLTIEGKGALNATGGRYAAGIGGGEREAGGAITINGGTVTATGGGYAAGIGGGYRAAGGAITISGGTVTATGGSAAAGIGGGGEGSGGTITISGGTVTATGGGSTAAGIGGGYSGSGGTIIISGGTVTATGGSAAAGIGGGYDGNSGTITINGGTVTATGGAAGIGGGYDGNSGTITINGGTVTATGGAAGIGGGYSGSGGTVTLGWTNVDDFIYASSYNVADLKFADGKQFYYVDEDGNSVKATKENIGGHKIMPYSDAVNRNLKNATISGIQPYYLYTGDEINIEYEVTDISGKKLVKDVDYVASIDGSKQVKEKGEYTVIITAKEGCAYNGTKTVRFAVGDAVQVTGETTEMKNRIYIVSSDVSIGERITIKGYVTLILGEGTTLEATKGIEVSEGNSLTIEGKGALNAIGSSYVAGIGGGSIGAGGTITINGGKVTAIGGLGAAGIGAGKASSCGDITIKEGVDRVTAVKGNGASYSISIGKCVDGVGTITIGGEVMGNITASPYTYPKIPLNVVLDGNGGSGEMNDQTLYVGTEGQKLNLNKFTRDGYGFAGWNTAKDGSGMAFADGGAFVLIDGEPGETVTLYAQWSDGDLTQLKAGGTFVAQDGFVLRGTPASGTMISIPDGASVTLKDVNIDGGVKCLGDATITLVGSNKVNAPAGYAGIWTGRLSTTLTINGEGSLEATGGDGGAGIGCSLVANLIGNYTAVNCGKVFIESGDITAVGGKYAAGIGMSAVPQADFYYIVGEISIKGGTVKAVGGDGAEGIGKGCIFDDVLSSGQNVAILHEISIYDDVKKVEASSINETVTYMHGDYDISTNKDAYFNIVEDGERRIITPKEGVEYAITIDKNIKNGTVTSRKSVRAGEKETLTLTPDNDCILGSLSVTDADGNVIKVTDNTFVMPASNVTVNAEFIRGSKIVLLDTLTKDYTAKDGDILMGTTEHTVTIDRVVSATTTVTLWNATINGGVISELDATIILEGDNYVKGKENEAGVWIPLSNRTLTIKGNGSLEADGGDNSAGIGIGGFERYYGGNLVIEGGSITARGGFMAAGIGAGPGLDYQNVQIGNIVIKGGSVCAYGIQGIGVLSGARMGNISIYHGVKVVDADISESVKYMVGETDVTSNPSEYFAIDGLKIRSLFAVNTDNIANGKVGAVVAAANGKAYADETVILNATPDFGYKVDFFTVKDATGNEIELKDNSFVMPLGDVSVSASFVSKYPALTFSDNGKKVTIDGNYDGTEKISIDADIPVDNVVLNRTLSTAGFSTITLPFGIKGSKITGAKQFLRFIGVKPNEQGVREVHMKRAWCDYDVVSKDIDAMNISNEDKEKAKASCLEVSGADVALSAYTPYVVQMKDNSLTFDVSAAEPVTLVKTPAAADTVVGNWVFRGTLAPKTWEPGDPEIGNAYGYMAGTGDFRKVGDNSSIGALRSYLVYEKQTGTQTSANVPGLSNIRANFSTETLPTNMNVVIVDDDENGKEHRTVIGKFNTRTGEFTPVLPENRTFDVKGRRVNETRSVGKGRKAKGVYYGKRGGRD